jgi:hypothetical protein
MEGSSLKVTAWCAPVREPDLNETQIVFLASWRALPG